MMDAIQKNERAVRPCTTLEIEVANHAGVMSHVIGLFSRRLISMEGILCLPMDGGRSSRIWLLLPEDPRLPQMIRQLQKLEDVTGVRQLPQGIAAFERLAQVFS
jgi:acetolactate synthase-1/3 small subunit